MSYQIISSKKLGPDWIAPVEVTDRSFCGGTRGYRKMDDAVADAIERDRQLRENHLMMNKNLRKSLRKTFGREPTADDLPARTEFTVIETVRDESTEERLCVRKVREYRVRVIG